MNLWIWWSMVTFRDERIRKRCFPLYLLTFLPKVWHLWRRVENVFYLFLSNFRSKYRHRYYVTELAMGCTKVLWREVSLLSYIRNINNHQFSSPNFRHIQSSATRRCDFLLCVCVPVLTVDTRWSAGIPIAFQLSPSISASIFGQWIFRELQIWGSVFGRARDFP